MADMHKLIDTILSETRGVSGGNLASKVYRDEPILMTASQLENRFPPAKYREMRAIAKNNGSIYDSYAGIFYKQGKFMEDFEDDFDYTGSFTNYFPTYQSLSDRQLRGYFSWRTRVRRGIIENTSLSFAFLYIYELLNRIGVNCPEEGFYALKNFWLEYRKIDYKISGYAKLWLKDYVVYNNLDKSLLEDIYDVNFDNMASILLNYKNYGIDEVFGALNSLSSYNLERSKFFKQYPEDVKNVVYGVFAALSEYHGKRLKNSLCEKFFGRFCSSPYSMFSSAVFFHQGRHPDLVYEISGNYKYICRDGNWACERFFRYKGKNRQIGVLLKNIDFLMRNKYEFKSTLKEEKITKILQGIINGEIDSCQKSKHKAAEIEIDISKLKNIREAALEIQNKLIVEEPEEADGLKPGVANGEPAGSENIGPENGVNLSDVEYQFMSCLLYGRPYGDLVKSRGLILSVLVDALNERFFDMFGDTVLAEDGGGPELIADYADELRGIIKG